MKRLWNKNFVLLLQGNAFSAIGDILYSVAIGYWVFEQTGSTALMGIMSSISMFMTMFLMPITGTIIDQINRKSVIVGMDFMRGILMLLVGILAYNKLLAVPIVLLVAVFASLCSVFFSPAVETVMLDIIPRNDYLQGQSVSRGLSSFIQLVGKAISGALVAFLGVPMIIVINGISFLISAITEYFIDIPQTKKEKAKIDISHIGKDLIEGGKQVLKHPILCVLIPCSLTINLLSSGAGSLIMPFCMEKGFTLNEYGYLMALTTGASLLCIAILGMIKLTPKQRYYALVFSFLLSVFFYGMAFISLSFYGVSFWYMLARFGNTLGNAIFDASFMLALPQDNRGTILGFVYAISSGGQAISSVIYGFLGEIFSLTFVCSLGNILCIIPMVYICFHKRMKTFILSN